MIFKHYVVYYPKGYCTKVGFRCKHKANNFIDAVRSMGYVPEIYTVRI